MRPSLEVAKLKHRTFIAGIIALTLIGIVSGIAYANHRLAAMAKCDEHGLVTINFSDGSSFTCIPNNQVPPSKPPGVKK